MLNLQHTSSACPRWGMGRRSFLAYSCFGEKRTDNDHWKVVGRTRWSKKHWRSYNSGRCTIAKGSNYNNKAGTWSKQAWCRIILKVVPLPKITSPLTNPFCHKPAQSHFLLDNTHSHTTSRLLFLTCMLLPPSRAVVVAALAGGAYFFYFILSTFSKLMCMRGIHTRGNGKGVDVMLTVDALKTTNKELKKQYGKINLDKSKIIAAPPHSVSIYPAKWEGKKWCFANYMNVLYSRTASRRNGRPHGCKYILYLVTISFWLLCTTSSETRSKRASPAVMMFPTTLMRPN